MKHRNKWTLGVGGWERKRPGNEKMTKKCYQNIRIGRSRKGPWRGVGGHTEGYRRNEDTWESWEKLRLDQLENSRRKDGWCTQWSVRAGYKFVREESLPWAGRRACGHCNLRRRDLRSESEASITRPHQAKTMVGDKIVSKITAESFFQQL